MPIVKWLNVANGKRALIIVAMAPLPGCHFGASFPLREAVLALMNIVIKMLTPLYVTVCIATDYGGASVRWHP